MLVAAAFALFGFILGIWADGFERLQIVPMLILTPLTFLGGTFYSIDMLAEPWRTIAQFNPIFYLINGLRWTFTGTSDVPIGARVRHDARLRGAVHRGHRGDLQDRLAAARLERASGRAMTRFHFTIDATDGAARTGAIAMRRGEIRTPAFMPVGTAATVKAMKPETCARPAPTSSSATPTT